MFLGRRLRCVGSGSDYPGGIYRATWRLFPTLISNNWPSSIAYTSAAEQRGLEGQRGASRRDNLRWANTFDEFSSMTEFTPPACDTANPADLEAWFGSFGYADHYRKVVLSSCREIIRASSTLGGQKLSEARIDDLARLHPNYLGFLSDSLNGRRIREENVRQMIGAT